MIPPMMLLQRIDIPGYRVLPRLWHRVMCRLLHIRVKVVGTPLENNGPVLFVSNHVSWMDILVLGHVAKASFIARGDMQSWPFLGRLSKLHETVFIDREKRSTAHQQTIQLSSRLANGDSLILFPEGTTSDGGRVLPFKSALFGVTEKVLEADAVKEHLNVQPVTLVYKQINNAPSRRHNRPRVAWYGDMDFGPHFWEALAIENVQVEVHFHEPISRASFKNRKEMTQYCQDVIEAGLHAALAQHPAA